ncbi:hypothetical protein AB4114_23335 [Paenibacillus sp. 2RAB27]|uniref:hypothetical protein n=1 Tax=Paenibacillus sp. 2RAB27 TaxID=3232991 RepID=UPI003F95BEF7
MGVITRWFLFIVITIVPLLTLTLLLNNVEVVHASVDDLVKYLKIYDFTIKDILITQFSLTFIILSLLSLLSSNAESIYWEDVISYKLVYPKFTNFVSISASLIGIMILSIIFTIINLGYYVYFSFGVAVILLIFLMSKMINIYFSRDLIKNELNKMFNQANEDKKQTHLYGLYEKTIQLLDENKYQYIFENFDFLVNKNENNTILKIMTVISDKSPVLFYDLLIKYDLYSNPAIQKITISLINNLIVNHSFPEIKRGILELMIGKLNKIDQSFFSNLYVQGINSALTGMEQHVIDPLVDDLSDKINNCISKLDKPIEQLYTAYIHKDKFAFDMILFYLEEMKNEFTTAVNNAFNEFGNEITNNFVFIYSFSQIRVDFCTEEERERIDQIIKKDEQEIYLLKKQLSRLSQLRDAKV